MFVKEIYIVFLFCLVEYQIDQCSGKERTVDLRHGHLEKYHPVSWKNNSIIRKKKEKKVKSSKKWPELLRFDKGKEAMRSTKMDMLQDNPVLPEPDEGKPIESNELKDEYLSSYDIKEQIKRLSRGLPGLNITFEVIGRTLEYQDILMLRITESRGRIKFFRADNHKYADEVPEKKIIFIVHGLSVMGVRNLPCLSKLKEFRKLLSYYTSHIDKFDLFLVPIANPDGYSYTGNTLFMYSSFWNKNVSPQSECPGVALDRNFEVAWETNRSISSCSQEYPGSTSFSEAETRAIRNIFHKYAHKIIAYFHVHAVSYDFSVFKGDAVLYPKGYSDYTSNDEKYIDLRSEIDEAVRNASFRILSVAVDTLYNWYGKVTGTSVDYASTVYGIPFAMELVMQHYEEQYEYYDSDHYTSYALKGVWKRVIDVIFEFIWKSFHSIV